MDEDDDLFADLYGDDEIVKPANKVAPAPAPAVKTEPTATPSVPNGLSAAQQPPPQEIEHVQQQSSIGIGLPDQHSTNGGTEQYWQQSQNQGQDSQQQGFGGNNFDGQNNGYGGGGGDNQGYNQGGNYGQNNQSNQNNHSHQESGSTGIKEDGKMFIGGLNWETTDVSLKEYFSQFGEVTECTVMRDGPTGRSRGFGFLTFADPKTVNIVMVKEHYLDGKIIDPKRAIPRDEQEKTSKIFVGGVSQDASEQDFREYFMQFGRVLDATLMIDKDTGRPRGFGFVTFDSEQAVENALAEPELAILGKPIEVKKAQPRGNIRDRNNDDDGGNNNFRSNNNYNNNNRGGANSYNNRNGGSDNFNAGGMGPGGGMAGAVNPAYQGMTPQLMAQYWQRMQQYWAAMQMQQAQMGRGRGGDGAQSTMPAMNPMMMAGMNPAMMAGMNPAMMAGMNPAMMAGMQGSPGGPSGFNGSGFPGGPQGQGQQPTTPNTYPQGPSSDQGQGQGQYASPPPQAAGQWDGGNSNGQFDDASGGQQSQNGQNQYNQGPPQNRQQFQQQQGGYQNRIASPVTNAPTGPRGGNMPGKPPPNAPSGPKSLRGGAPTGPGGGGGGSFRGAGRGFVNRGNQGGGGYGRGFHPYARNNNNQNQNQGNQ